MKLRVRVKPGSKRGDLVQANSPYLDVFLREHPVDGKANEALLKVLAVHFGVTEKQIWILSGFSSRIKLVEIGGPEGT
ncbi:MAG: DUF167 domain-containing protein [Actinobacteria bacterium]|nr:DUF167 domain-containing protein [Actinomycetota bacterium]